MTIGAGINRVMQSAVASAFVLLIVVAAAAPPRAHAACDRLRIDGKQFSFEKSVFMTCKTAKGLARRTYIAGRPPPGWKCPRDGNRRDGAECLKRRNPLQYYEYR